MSETPSNLASVTWTDGTLSHFPGLLTSPVHTGPGYQTNERRDGSRVTLVWVNIRHVEWTPEAHHAEPN